ncbi:hypothetical protein CONCODRAFT_18239 [Conidiobolus coronatus NRRL 28638]|uniref:Uncharacterized protein n=1 Tax=Conidiobolus coronatus (strain ATCC 28846 / CBS 209.66 / NRRL 28638) TaxID=796925 RepID=A0A137P3J9_CONC2|nr:hypothetical protein CONCODRAFT_18239 [Conidiobolus coronatus NRRL 28638]|eukprot:KXN69583.1 hypothetical protein CONCODRAFT_18239 [Conidiobolus coronatus NRRL 28638]
MREKLMIRLLVFCVMCSGIVFFERIRPSTPLFMGRKTTSADPDVSVLVFPQQIQGVIVAEDRLTTSENAVIARLNAEAQMIAEGIAASQADNWPPNNPVYMLRCLGSLVFVYRATFTPQLLNAVRQGQPAKRLTIVSKYEPRLAPHLPLGLNIFDPQHRQRLVHILCSIEYDIVTRILALE